MKHRLSGLLLTACILMIAQFIVIQDLNETVEYQPQYDNNDFLFGMVLPISKEIYYQDWVYIEKCGDAYNKQNTKLIDSNHSKTDGLIKFPCIVDDGYLYYGEYSNHSNDDDWYKIRFDKRRNITFNWSTTVLDNFSDVSESGWAKMNNDKFPMCPAPKVSPHGQVTTALNR